MKDIPNDYLIKLIQSDTSYQMYRHITKLVFTTYFSSIMMDILFIYLSRDEWKDKLI